MTDVFKDDPDRIDEEKNYLEELVGENKKFKSTEDLARGKAEADAFINKLTKEMEDLRIEVEKRKTVEEIADQLRRREDKALSNQDNQDGEPEPKRLNSEITKEDVERLLEEKLAKSQHESKTQTNLKAVNDMLTEKLGSAAGRVIRERANGLGVSIDYLEGLARENPKVFFRLIDLDSQPQQVRNSLPRDSLNTAGTTSLGDTERTDSYYRKMFEKEPKLRFDKKINVQMHKDAQRLGEKFFD